MRLTLIVSYLSVKYFCIIHAFSIKLLIYYYPHYLNTFYIKSIIYNGCFLN